MPDGAVGGIPSVPTRRFATAALFADVAAFILRHVSDEGAKRDVTAGAASGYVFIDELPEPDRTNVLTVLRDEFRDHVDSVIYPSDVTSGMDGVTEILVARAKSLARMAGKSIALRGVSGAMPEDRG
ncbi:hypothetical protein [Streptomyces fagopyri]|uniref:hypothetical protein n=1 Tax=Streptomyces fagopyri TaxID=2662397 RepID=UPI00371306BE